MASLRLERTGPGITRTRHPKNILVLTEHFAGGGLETQLCTQAQYLAERDVHLHLVTGSRFSPVAADAFAGTVFDLPFQGTAQCVLESVCRVEDYALQHRIDVIHVHPFLSFAVGMVVAQRLGLPLVATLHGPSSVSLLQDTIYDALFRHALLPDASRVFAVSEEVKFLARAVAPCSPVVLPNAVPLSVDPPRADPLSADPLPPSLDLPWLWAGRLDQDKIVGLKSLIAEVLRHGRNSLHIYGDGPERGALQEHLKEVCPQADLIVYKGWDDHLSDHLSAYSLVAGMGRVLLEAGAASRPCLLVGYDGIKGLLTESDMEKAAAWNFSGRGMRTITSDELDVQLQALERSPQQFVHREWIRQNRSVSTVWDGYLDQIADLQPFSSAVAKDFIGCLNYSGSIGVNLWGDWRVLALLKNMMGMRNGRRQ